MYYAPEATTTTVPPTTRPLDDPDWLERAYVKQGRTVRSIAQELGASHVTVWRRLVKCGIPRRRRRSSALACADREWLQRHYLDEGRSLRGCAAIAGASHESVRHWLRVFNLPVRDLHEAVAHAEMEPYP
jgi:transposase-like protein